MNKDELIARVDQYLEGIAKLRNLPSFTVNCAMGRSAGELIVTISTTDPDMARTLRQAQAASQGRVLEEHLTPEQIEFLEVKVTSCQPVTAGEFRSVGLEPSGFVDEDIEYKDDTVVGVVIHTGQFSYSVDTERSVRIPRNRNS